MKGYSKENLDLKRFFTILFVIFFLFILFFISLFFYIKYNNYFKYENIDTSSMHVNDDIAKNSYPIIVNNIIIGAVYNDKWVSSARYNKMSTNKIGTEVDLFSFDGKYGSFKIIDMKNNTAFTNKFNYYYEYYGVKKDSIKSIVKVYNLNSEDKYINIVDKALGKYKFLNDSIKISEIYGVNLVNNETAYIIVVTSDNKENNFGAYSAIIYGDDYGNTSIIKYNYVVNKKDASNFNIYSIKFINDFNNDNVNDIVISETNEFSTKYSIMEKRNNKFYEVLSYEID